MFIVYANIIFFFIGASFHEDTYNEDGPGAARA